MEVFIHERDVEGGKEWRLYAGTIASRLAQLMNQTPAYQDVLTAAANGTQVQLRAKNAGIAGNLAVTSSVTYNSVLFPAASVVVADVAMAGDVDGVNTHPPVVAYQYQNATWQDNGSLESVEDSLFGQQNVNYDTLNRPAADVINEQENCLPSTSSAASVGSVKTAHTIVLINLEGFHVVAGSVLPSDAYPILGWRLFVLG